MYHLSHLGGSPQPDRATAFVFLNQRLSAVNSTQKILTRLYTEHKLNVLFTAPS
jgi:hypothetical protein